MKSVRRSGRVIRAGDRTGGTPAMLFGSFSKSQPPSIAVDFGVSRVKVLQLRRSEDGQTSIAAAACRATPPELIDLPAPRLEHQTKDLTEMLKSGMFKGRRVVCSIPSTHAVVQHLHVQKDNAKGGIDASIKEEIRTLTGRDPTQFIFRHLEVAEVVRSGQKRTEVICFAMPREVVLAYMTALRGCKLDVVGVHAEHLAMVKSMQRLLADQNPKSAVMIIDLGYAMTKVAVAHGTELVLAKAFPIAGCQFSAGSGKAVQAAADPALAAKQGLRAQLAALEAADTKTGVALLEKPPAVSPAPQSAEISSSIVDALSDELSQCMRYHQALFPDRRLERVIFVGGEAARMTLCKQIARTLGLPAQVADPLAALPRPQNARYEGLESGAPSPGWAVAVGLCDLPTDV